jgi:general secretion pathway protein G
MRLFKHVSDAKGVTLLELIVAVVILSILATVIMPLSVVSYKRTKEMQLRQHLRLIRNALDEYKQLTDEGLIAKSADSSGYPESLEVLVKGVDLKTPKPLKRKFLRRIPKDPFSEDGEWGLRSYADDSESTIWGGQDVYDIYSQSDKQSLDGTYYKDW